jgi:hypothetical protein
LGGGALLDPIAGMHRPVTALVLLLATPARADAPLTYIGASFELTSGLAGASEWGGALQVALRNHLEVEVSAIRHEVDGDPFAAGADDHDVWIFGGTARGRLPVGHAAFVAGFGVLAGEHGVVNGCRSEGFLDFCGDRQGTLIYRHWRRAIWLRPELGGEIALGPIAARLSVSPLVLLGGPDDERGCVECSDGMGSLLFTIGIHGRIPL